MAKIKHIAANGPITFFIVEHNAAGGMTRCQPYLQSVFAKVQWLACLY